MKSIVLFYIAENIFNLTLRMNFKYPGKTDHSHLEIFRHTDYVPGGDPMRKARFTEH